MLRVSLKNVPGGSTTGKDAITWSKLHLICLIRLRYALSIAAWMNTAWITAESGGLTVFFALKEFYTSSGGGVLVSYGDCADSSDACEQCERDGNSAFGLLFIAAIFSMMTAIACGLFWSIDRTLLQNPVQNRSDERCARAGSFWRFFDCCSPVHGKLLQKT